MLTARATAIDLDDGSLGGWLPADPDRSTTASSSSTAGGGGKSPVPSWKVYTAVVLAQYPLYELNALWLIPALESAAGAGLDLAAVAADASSSSSSSSSSSFSFFSFGGHVLQVPARLFVEAPQAVRGLAVAAWTAVGAVFFTLPLAQRLLRWYGFIGGENRSCPGLPELSRGAAATAMTYGVAVAGFHAVQQPELVNAVVKAISSS